MTPGGHLAEVLPRFSLRRRVTVTVLGLTVVVVGLVATANLPLEMVPRGMQTPSLSVLALWRDAPPAEVVDKVLTPLEDELATVRGLDNLDSVARRGFGRVMMEFKSGTDMRLAYRQVRDRIERARAHLPRDIDRLLIRKQDASGIPITGIGIGVPEGLIDVYDLVQNEVILPLSRIDGVAAVQADGLLEREVLVELDRAKTEAAGLNLFAVAEQLRGDNLSVASGHVMSGGRKLLLRSDARFEDLAALRNRPITPRLRLGDIADVHDARPEKNWRVRVNGRDAFALFVQKEGDANTIEVTRKVRRTIEELKKKPRLADLDLMVFFDQGTIIEESLATLLDSGRLGALCAAVVLFFFLRRLALTLVVTLSIPLSTLMALTVMYFLGESLNVISLLSLMICVGLLVDNSVVVAENIHRLHQQGISPVRAVVEGTAEIGLAITTATLTTIVVFLPVSLVEGEAQFMMLRMSIPLSLALSASLLVAGIFMPLATAWTLRRRTSDRFDRGRRLLANLYDQTLGRLNRIYTRLLASVLDRRGDVLFLLTLALVVTYGWASRKLDFAPMQEEEQPGFDLAITLPRDTTFEETSAYFSEVERVVQRLKPELGLEGYFLFHRQWAGRVQGWFAEERTTDVTPRQAARRVIDALPERPGVEIYTGDESDFRAKEDLGTYRVSLYGPNPDQLEETARRLTPLFAKAPGVIGVRRGEDDSPNEIGLLLDRDLLQRQGIPPMQVAGLVGAALRGFALPRLRRKGIDVPVRLRYAEEDRDSLADLEGFALPTAGGGRLSLGALAIPLLRDMPQRIARHNRVTSRWITLDLEEGREQEAREHLRRIAERLDLPRGVSFEADAAGSDTAETLNEMVLAGLLSIVFVYLLMGILFESFLLPLSILATLPLAALGVVWIHLLAGKNLDLLGSVAVVLLIGVVVNNGIVLIDTVNRLRQAGLDRRQALLTAADRRFRPIMMTALTTIFGMIPVAAARASSIGLSYTSFGLTLIGGLSTATVLTLWVVPLFYAVIDEGRLWVGALAARWVSSGRSRD